jgi:hypothetical protein
MDPPNDLLVRRALDLWPRLDRRALHRVRHDPTRIARLVARRTSLSVETIVQMLVTAQVTRVERETWFG